MKDRRKYGRNMEDDEGKFWRRWTFFLSAVLVGVVWGTATYTCTLKEKLEHKQKELTATVDACGDKWLSNPAIGLPIP